MYGFENSSFFGNIANPLIRVQDYGIAYTLEVLLWIACFVRGRSLSGAQNRS